MEHLALISIRILISWLVRVGPKRTAPSPSCRLKKTSVTFHGWLGPRDHDNLKRQPWFFCRENFQVHMSHSHEPWNPGWLRFRDPDLMAYQIYSILRGRISSPIYTVTSTTRILFFRSSIVSGPGWDSLFKQRLLLQMNSRTGKQSRYFASVLPLKSFESHRLQESQSQPVSLKTGVEVVHKSLASWVKTTCGSIHPFASFRSLATISAHIGESFLRGT